MDLGTGQMAYLTHLQAAQRAAVEQERLRIIRERAAEGRDAPAASAARRSRGIPRPWFLRARRV